MKSIPHNQTPSRRRFPVPKTPAVGLALFLLAMCIGIQFVPGLPFGKGGSREFNRFVSEVFLEEAAANTMNLHFTVSDPAAVGITDYKPTLGDFSKKARKNSVRSTKELRRKLDGFSYRALSSDEKLVYDVLSDYLSRQAKLNEFALYDEVLTPSGGVTSQLPILLAEYPFRTRQDIEDYLSLLSQMDTYFSQILEFEQEKADAGLFMSDSSCAKIIESCEVFVLHPDDNFLLTTFDNRLSAVGGLSESDMEDYKARNRQAMADHVIPAYRTMITGLTGLMGCGRNSWGLCNYDRGKEYYAALVAYYTGCSDTVEELAAQIEEKRASDLAVCTDLLTKTPELLNKSDSAALDFADETAMVEHLETAMLADFPKAPDSRWEVVHVDPSLSDYLAPAFYITAPIDNYLTNKIYINNVREDDSLYLFTTLAHEGFPGHLYQTVASYDYGMNPLHTMLNYPGFTEGWATYVEMQSYYYAGLDEDLASLMQHNQAAMLSLYATSDIGIHYLGWKKADMIKFWESYGISSEETVDVITRLILEEPGNYLKYYVGYMKFCQLRAACEEKQKDRFDPVDFHEQILRIGPAPFALLEKKLLK